MADHTENTSPGNEPATDPAADALAALDAGIAAAESDDTVPAAEPTPDPVDPPADDPPVGDPPAQDPPAADPPAQDPPNPEGDPPADPPAPEPDADTEAEITSLGLKEKSAERFRTLAAEVKELAPIRDALKEAGIEDIASLPQLVERSKMGEDMVQMVSETGATPDQYGMALDYLGLISKAARGDMSAAEQAYTTMMAEASVLAKMLGKELPGVHDPLADHADLQAEVAAGDLPRARALEIAATRAREATTTAATRHQQETAQQAQQAEQGGISWLKQFDTQMKAEDPAYLAKRPALNEAVAQIRERYHPSDWPQQTALAYARIAAPAPAAVPPPAAAPAQPRPGVMRPSGPRPTMVPTFDDPMKALEFGIEQASGG